VQDRTPSILSEFKLRITPARQFILGLFLKSEFAISHTDIDGEINESLDRITVYRTLKTFLKKGLIHQVPDDKGAMKYALCSGACSPANHSHDHVHFKCLKCGQTNCLNISIPSIKLPKGYASNDTSILIQGVCKHCS
jgi:Fur family ferric uptake transcriptional regulator